MLGRTSDCFPICFGQFQPTSKNLMDKALKKEKKVKFTLEVGRSTRTLDCFYLSRHGGDVRLGGSVTVRWEGGVRSRPSVRSVSGSLEGRFPSLTLLVWKHRELVACPHIAICKMNEYLGNYSDQYFILIFANI